MPNSYKKYAMQISIILLFIVLKAIFPINVMISKREYCQLKIKNYIYCEIYKLYVFID